MEMHQLRSFVAIVERMSFSRAAEDLNLSQPSLSRQIRELETQLGAPLFNRERRAISLTAAGSAFVPAARAALAEAERGRRAVRDVLGARGGPLAIGASPQTAATVLAPLLGRWRREHPDVEVRIVEDDAASIVAMLGDGRLDVGVVPLDAPAPLEVVPFLSARVRALAPASHPLLGAGQIDLRALVAPPGASPIPLLLLKERYLTRLKLSAAWEEAGLRPHIAMESAVGQTLAAYAEAGLGVAVLPETVDIRGFDLVSAVVTDGARPLVLRNGLGWDPRRYLSPAARAFIAAATKPPGAAVGARFGQAAGDRTITDPGG